MNGMSACARVCTFVCAWLTVCRYCREAIVARRTDPKYVTVVAPTGRAACGVGGVTVHRCFRFNPRFGSTGKGMLNKGQWRDKLRDWTWRQQLQRLGTLIVDEISMLDAEFLEVVDDLLRTVFPHRKHAPFGGVQVSA